MLASQTHPLLDTELFLIKLIAGPERQGPECEEYFTKTPGGHSNRGEASKAGAQETIISFSICQRSAP